MRRTLAILDYALGATRRRGGRNLAIAAGLAFVVGLVSAVLLLTGALEREFALSVDATPDLVVQRVVGGRPGLIEVDSSSALSELPAVSSVRPRVWGYLFVPSLEANVTIVGATPGELGEALSHQIVEGRGPRPGANQECLAGAALAKRLGLRPGDGIALPVHGDIRVLDAVGLFHADSALHSADVLVVSESMARDLLGIPQGMATDLAIRLTTPDEAGVVANHLERALGQVGQVRVLDKRLLARTYELTFGGRSGLSAIMLLPALAAFLLLAWERLTGLGGVERREIGVLKAIGWSTSDVLLARLLESGLVSLGGTLFGLLAGYVYVFQFGAPGLRAALLGWSTLYPELVLVPNADLGQAAALLGAVVVPFIATSLVPAWRAAVVDPDETMRGAA
ncbi:MAG: FtsX-like permease family protein [Deltaproteobacteria bacterium]|nr:FtsX-like permease family protein [Deltaproteobacteria bacterium]